LKIEDLLMSLRFGILDSFVDNRFYRHVVLPSARGPELKTRSDGGFLIFILQSTIFNIKGLTDPHEQSHVGPQSDAIGKASDFDFEDSLLLSLIRGANFT
jgi:hypothetical protein